jgi:hypothetical protein
MLSDAIEKMVSTYQPLDHVARGLVVDAQEVADALAKAPRDSVEFVVLTVLAKYNQVVKVGNKKHE